jgi:hypothetical protein
VSEAQRFWDSVIASFNPEVTAALETCGFGYGHTGGGCTCYDMNVEGGRLQLHDAEDGCFAPDDMDCACELSFFSDTRPEVPAYQLRFPSVRAFVEAARLWPETWNSCYRRDDAEEL